MGITQGILDAAIEAAHKAGASRITAVNVSVGELTEIIEDALQFAFDALKPDTLAADAVLNVTMITPRSHCNDCDIDYDHDRFQMVCPTCESFAVTPLNGRELQIDSIDTEDDSEE